MKRFMQKYQKVLVSGAVCLVLALALARLVRSSGDPNADPSDMLLPLVVLLAAPFLIYLRTKHEKEEEELEQKWREKQDSDPPPP